MPPDALGTPAGTTGQRGQPIPDSPPPGALRS